MTRRVSDSAAPPRVATLNEIFFAFLLIGATSFGGGAVAYLRSSLVAKHGWLDDREFVELLSISQTLPGLNATNMAVLVGDRLRGTRGSIAAICGMCLPGALIMIAAGIVYRRHGDRPAGTAMLHGVAAEHLAYHPLHAITLHGGRHEAARQRDAEPRPVRARHRVHHRESSADLARGSENRAERAARDEAMAPRQPLRTGTARHRPLRRRRACGPSHGAH